MKTKKDAANSEVKVENPVDTVIPDPFEPGAQPGHMEKPEPLTDEYVSGLLTSDKTSWNIVIPKKNILIIIILALLSWGIVGLISLLVYRIY